MVPRMNYAPSLLPQSMSKTWWLPTALLVLLLASGKANAQWSDSFETPECSWWMVPGSKQHHLRESQRVFRDARDGVGFERLLVAQRGKAPIHLAHRVDPMLVIEELVVRLWVKSSKVGVRLGARLTLPNTRDSKTGDRLSFIVLGQELTEPNRWTLLKLDGLPKLLETQLPTLRKSNSTKIDTSGAYLDRIVVQDASGFGENQICVDGLIIDGVAFPTAKPRKSRSGLTSAKTQWIGKATATAKAPYRVKVSGGILEIDDQPVFVRSIESSGESLQFLQSLGFNAVELREPPTLAQDQEAKRLGLLLIAPPMFDPQLNQKQQALTSVVAWSLGQGLGEAELESARKYIAEFRSREAEVSQIFVAGPTSHRWEWSRLVDLLIADMGSPLTDQELSDQGARLKSLRQGGRPGAPAWSVIHTEPSPALVSQWNSFTTEGFAAASISPEQVRLQAMHAILGGVRGLYFKSASRLDGKNPADELRAATLKWVNLQLDLVAPWAATGDTSILSPPGSETLVGALTTDRATLLIMINPSPRSQYEVSGEFIQTTKTPVMKVFERSPLFQVSWRGIRQLNISDSRAAPHNVLTRNGDVDYLLVTDDSTALRFTKETLEQRRAEVAALQLQIASLWLGQTQANLQLSQNSLALAQTKITEASRELGRGNEHQSIQFSEEAMRKIASARHDVWSRMVAPLPHPLISPLCVSADLAQLHSELTQRIAQQAWTANRLPAGDLESISAMEDAGWLAYQTKDPLIETEIVACNREPHLGQGALSLISRKAKSDRQNDRLVVAITTAPVPVRRGDLVRYRLWLRSGELAQTGSDQVHLFDSLGGRELQFKPPISADWAPLAFYRFAPADGDATLTVGLQGLGAVDIDSIEIQTLSSAQISKNSVADR